MKSQSLFGAAVVLIFSSGRLLGLEGFVLYDRFDNAFIDPEKWVIAQQGGPAHREFVREIRNGRLRLLNRAYGDISTNTGGSFDGTFIDFPQPDAVTAFGADVEVKRFETSFCPSSPAVASSRLELHGTFFNTDVPQMGSHSNDVRASIAVQRTANSPDPSDVLHVTAFVIHCLDVTCSAGQSLAFHDLGAIRIGDRARLAMRWDRDNHQFIFSRDAESFAAPYGVSDDTPSGAKRKGLLVANFVTNCMSTVRPIAFMEAMFDRVMVNASAAH